MGFPTLKMRYSFRVNNLAQVGQAFKNTSSLLRNPAHIYKELGSQTKIWIRKNFESQGGMHERSNLKWKPLASSTRENKQRNSSQILMDSGKLKNEWDMDYSSNHVRVKSRMDYSAYHEYGAKVKKHRISAKGKGGRLRYIKGGGLRTPMSVMHPGARIPKRKILPTKLQAEKRIAVPVFKYFVVNEFIRGIGG